MPTDSFLQTTGFMGVYLVVQQKTNNGRKKPPIRGLQISSKGVVKGSDRGAAHGARRPDKRGRALSEPYVDRRDGHTSPRGTKWGCWVRLHRCTHKAVETVFWGWKQGGAGSARACNLAAAAKLACKADATLTLAVWSMG